MIRSYIDLEAHVDSVEVRSLLAQSSLEDRDALVALIHTLPLKITRHFSISSSPKYHPHTLHIAIARRPGGKVSEPLTNPSDSSARLCVDALIRHSKFSLPDDSSSPIILVGTGTGVGPLRGMMHGRLAAQEHGGLDKTSRGSITSIVGFRCVY